MPPVQVTLEVTLATIMGDLINDEEVEPTEGILHHEEGIDLMPGISPVIFLCPFVWEHIRELRYFDFGIPL